MRKILLLSFLLLTLAPYTASISGAAVAAQTRSDSRSSRLNPKHNGRPRMPSRDYIDCTPGAGVISFEANFDFYAMTVIIGDEDAPILPTTPPLRSAISTATIPSHASPTTDANSTALSTYNLTPSKHHML